MRGFLSALDVELVDPAAFGGRGLWRLRSPLTFNSPSLGFITVKEGFETDFSSVPLVPLVFDIFGGLAHAPGAVHDWLYAEAMVPRKAADLVLFEAALASGVSLWKSALMYYAVRRFGSKHYGFNRDQQRG